VPAGAQTPGPTAALGVEHRWLCAGQDPDAIALLSILVTMRIS
jgi:hypothetical protein